MRVATERARSRQVAMIVALVLAFMAPQLYAQLRVGIVDMQRAILETNQGRRAKAQLKRLFESRQEQLNQRQEALKRMKEEIQKQSSVVRGEALQKRMEDYNKRLVDLQQDYVGYQQELAQKEAELTKQILVNLQGVVRQLGTSENFNMILDQGAVIWSPTHLDLTDRVIQLYNTEHPAADAPAAAEGDAGAAAAPAARPAARPAAGGAAARPAARPAATGATPHPRSDDAAQP